MDIDDRLALMPLGGFDLHLYDMCNDNTCVGRHCIRLVLHLMDLIQIVESSLILNVLLLLLRGAFTAT